MWDGKWGREGRGAGTTDIERGKTLNKREDGRGGGRIIMYIFR